MNVNIEPYSEPLGVRGLSRYGWSHETRLQKTRAPWQNGLAERWDHVITLNEQHLRRLVRDYVSYYHQDRIHDSLGKDTPNRRPVEPKRVVNATLISLPRLGELHNRYSWYQLA